MLPLTLQVYLYVYGAVALTHILVQVLLGHLDFARQRNPKFAEFYNGHLPSVTVVVPVFNEDPTILDQCLGSIFRQDITNLEIIVVDDGSDNLLDHEETYRRYDPGRLQVIELEKNVGKRRAQKVAFDRANGEIIVTVDSDTILHGVDSVRKLVNRFKDPQVGAVTGDVHVENRHENLLTRLIACRYWMAFHQERASQSYFGVMMCCSGPFAAYRKSHIDAVKEEYVTQQFLGRPCTFGDDRHLTNLILRKRCKVVFVQSADAYTHVPNTIMKYLRQQLRWSKSFYREIWWTLRFVHQRHAFMGVELVLQALLPFMLMGALVLMVYQAVVIDVDKLWYYALIVLAIGILRSGYGLWRTHHPQFLLFMGYGFLHVFLLVPVRLVALATMYNTKWGTRSLPAADFETQEG